MRSSIRHFIPVATALLAGLLAANAQSPLRSVYTVNTIAELESLRPASISSGGRAVVDVLGYYSPGDWGGRRQFRHDPTNAEPRDGGHVFTNAAASGRWISSDRRADLQPAISWGLTGDGATDNADRFDALVAASTNRTIHIELSRGDYITTRPIRQASNHPLKITSGAGSYRTGWLASNDRSESRIIYIGPMTNRFVDLTPAQGFRYGLDLSGITIDANGLAKEALHVERNTRGALDPIRCINATERNFVLENSYDLTVRFSSSANEEPFVTATPVGLAVTNAANANVFLTPTISGMTDVAVSVAGQSKANTFIGGAIESNPGGAFRFRDGANQNGVIGTWLENNGATNWIDIGDGVLHTEIFRVYSENRGGRINIDGSHSSIARSSFGAMQFGASAGENRVEDVLLGIGVLPTGNIADQTLWNVKDATATLATNTVSKSIALRGEVLDLIDRNYAYPAARLRRDSIMFGDGTNGLPSVGWYRASAVSLATTNSILQIAGGANNGLWTAYVTGDAQPRVSVYPGRIALGGGGTNPPDVNLSWMAPNTILSDSGMLTVRSSGSSTLLSGYTTGSAQPSVRVTIDGTMTWGLGGTNPGDVTLGKSGVGELQVTPDFRVASGLVLGGVRRTSWPSGSGVGGVVVYTNDFTTAKTFWSGMGSQLLLISNHVGATTITLSTNSSPTNATPPTAGTLVSVTDLGDPGPFYGFSVQGTTNWVTTYGRLTQDWLWDGTNWVHLGVRLPLPPNDGSTYGVKYGYWSALPITSDAPSDSQTYGRLNGSWAAVGGGGGGGTNHNSLTGLEGGGSGHYYHLSQADHTDLTDGGDSALHYHATDRNRTNHFGTQAWSTISDGDTNLWQKIIAVLRRGKGIQFTTNSGANTLTIADNNIPGANLSTVTNADGSVTWSASTGSTNSGTAVSVDGGATLASANIADSSEFDFTATGTNVTGVLKTNGVSAGSYVLLVGTVDSKGRLTSAATATSAQLLSILALGPWLTNSAGTLLFNVVIGAGLTTSTNGSQVTLSATGSGGGGDVYTPSNNILTGANRFTSSNAFEAPIYVRGNTDGAIIFHDTNGPGTSDIHGFYSSSGGLIGFTGESNTGPRTAWLAVTRSAGYPNAAQIQLTALDKIVLSAETTNTGSFGAPTIYAGTRNVGALLDAAANQWTYIPRGFQPGTNLFALFNTTNSMPVRVFDPDTEWNYRYLVVPPGNLAALPGTIRVKSFWRPIIGNSASQNIIVAAKYEGVVDSDSFTAANNVTNTVSSQTWIAFTNTLGTSNMTIGTPFVLNLSAPAGGSATNLYQMQEGIGVYWY